MGNIWCRLLLTISSPLTRTDSVAILNTVYIQYVGCVLALAGGSKNIWLNIRLTIWVVIRLRGINVDLAFADVLDHLVRLSPRYVKAVLSDCLVTSGESNKL